MKIKKLSAFILAGALTCTTPAMVYADTTSDAVDQAVSVLENSGVDDLLSDPDKVVDIIVAAKDAIGQVDVSDEELAARRAKWQPRQPKVTTGYLARYAHLVTSGNRGAILEIQD